MSTDKNDRYGLISGTQGADHFRPRIAGVKDMLENGYVTRGKISAIAISFILVLILIPDVNGQESIPERGEGGRPYTLSRGITHEFGGGSYLLFRFNDTVTFGIVYGNAKVSAPITVFSRGFSIDGFHGRGPVLSSVFTAYRLDGIVEYDDLDGNGNLDRGLGDGNPDGDPGGDEETVPDDQEGISKSISLKRDWTLSPIRSMDDRSRNSWSFRLIAKDIPYDQRGPEMEKKGLVEEVMFTFHITVKPVEARARIVEIDSRGSKDDVSSTTSETEKELHGHLLDLEVDHSIRGWDPDTDSRRASLHLRTNMVMGRTFGPDDLSLEDATSKVLRRTGIKGTTSRNEDFLRIPDIVDYRTDEVSTSAGDGRIMMDTGGPGSTSIGFVSGIDTGNGKELARDFANLQIHSVDWKGPRDKFWDNSLTSNGNTYGVMISGGFNYPASEMIIHDPNIRTYGWTLEDKSSSFEVPQTNQTGPLQVLGSPITLPIIIGSVIILVVGLIALSLSFKRREVWVINDELMDEEEEEVFTVRSRKRDWDELKID